MTQLDNRIAQFEKMCAEDADNDMAHFSLGGAYNQAGRYADAARAFERCIALNPGFSKAYQLAGAAYMADQQTDKAKKILLDGYHIASTRGDLMPRNAIAQMLEQLGEPIPQVESEAPPPPEGSFLCKATGRPGTPMDKPPFKGPVGQWIKDNISQETFKAWIAQGTKVINELRLDLSNDEDSEIYDKHMREFLGIDDDLYEQLQHSSSSAQ